MLQDIVGIQRNEPIRDVFRSDMRQILSVKAGATGHHCPSGVRGVHGSGPLSRAGPSSFGRREDVQQYGAELKEEKPCRVRCHGGHCRRFMGLIGLHLHQRTKGGAVKRC